MAVKVGTGRRSLPSNTHRPSGQERPASIEASHRLPKATKATGAVSATDERPFRGLVAPSLRKVATWRAAERRLPDQADQLLVIDGAGGKEKADEDQAAVQTGFHRPRATRWSGRALVRPESV